jgi:hypothetical protein
MNGTLGFSVACSQNYLPLLRGYLASIKFFAPDAPICMVIHGEMDTRFFEKAYGVQPIRQRDVRNPDLRKTCWGFGTKPVAFWEAPFDYVFHIDVDAVLWGDVRKNLPLSGWDIVYNEPHEEITEFIQRTQYFDPELVFPYIPEFDWEGCPFFQSGVLCVKKGSLDLDEYLHMTRIQEKHPHVFPNGDQGMLNILVFRAMKEGKLNVAQAHLQSVVPVLSKGELESRFQVQNGEPVLWRQPTVVHWAGPKPYTTNPDVFSLPMDFFREIGMREFGLPGWVPAKAAMRADEIWHRDVPKAVLNAKRMVKRVIGRR